MTFLFDNDTVTDTGADEETVLEGDEEELEATAGGASAGGCCQPLRWFTEGDEVWVLGEEAEAAALSRV